MRAFISGFVSTLVFLALSLFIADTALSVLERINPAPTPTVPPCEAPKPRLPIPYPEAGRAVIVDGRAQWANDY